ncbi:hypothetical protein M011DRAFT_455223 [Sporormia fimetaria CBS 119925]|uniref:Uncharacterized protein n=1 Tax=Sporormia fimetaria CBS 119925 TaxID=1340428 RepID=A0A6A6VNN8_9PLEO|nr:hypothetical protein M011DRAFT_455223 [Sporormia fimetaria CBS 119925]
MTSSHHYVDREVQTDIAGLAKHPAPVPKVLTGQAVDATPPEDTALPKLTMPPHQPIRPAHDNPAQQLRRGFGLQRPGGDERPASPPPTLAVDSPLPEANTLHAGHTPLVPEVSLSPTRNQESSRDDSPDSDPGLSSALMLPTLPSDGASDRIELRMLDRELEKIAKAQRKEEEAEKSRSAERTRSESSGESIRSQGQSLVLEPPEAPDGVILKKPKMNLGAPLGQA